DPALDALLARLEPRRLTPTTVVGKKELRKAILKARHDGFSLVDQEAEIGFRSILVPVRRHDGKVLAALNIGVRSERCAPATTRGEFLPKLRAAAADLQRQLV